MKKQSTTNATTNAIIDYLNVYGHVAWRNNRAAVYDRKFGGHRRAIKTAVGTADIIACIRPDGGMLQIEVKTPQDKPSIDQMLMQEKIVKAGGRYIFVANFDDFLKQLGFALFVSGMAI